MSLNRNKKRVQLAMNCTLFLFTEFYLIGQTDR